MDVYLDKFGIVSDPAIMQTTVIQTAVDQCASTGGGTVWFPSGIFLTGTLYMRSHVYLHLPSGCVLKGSDNFSDYNAPDAWVQNQASEHEHTNGAHLIVFLEVEDSGITGTGIIDGNGMAFGYRRNVPDWLAVKKNPEIKRPSQMVYLCESSNITLRDIHLENSPYWNCFVWGCNSVIISGLRIHNNQEIPNGDGIDIDASRNVIVSDCIIDTEDDCITFRCCPGHLKNKQCVLEDVTVTNCQLRTPGCNAFRIGVGTGPIRNCLVSNVSIRGSSKGICLEARYASNTDDAPGTLIENISFTNLFMESHCPVFIASFCRGIRDIPAPPIRNIRFSNMTILAEEHIAAEANEGAVVENISFSNMTLEYSGAPSAVDQYGYGEWDHVTSHGAFYLANISGISLRDISVKVKDAASPVKAVILQRNVQELSIDNIKGTANGQNLPVLKDA